MLNDKIGRSLNRVFYYGWIIIAVSALSYFFSAPGQTYFISAFIDQYIKEFNYTRTSISTIYSTATVISGFLLVFMGRFVDKYGQRKMFLIVGSMLAIASLFTSFITNIILIFISFFVLRYFGQGSLTLLPGSLVPQWFEKRRALAISLASMGGILATMVVPKINISLIEMIGWRQTWRVWSILLIVVFVPIMYVFVINKPEDIDLKPDNKKMETEEEAEQELISLERDSWTLNDALKTKEFWMISLISMLPPMVSTGLTFHFFSIMLTKGVSENASSFVIGLIAVPGFFIPIIAGLLIDHIKPKILIFITLSIITLDLFFMLTVNTVLAASIFMLVYGLATNIQRVTIDVIYVNYFGRKYLGSIKGTATVFMVVGSALGPIPFGLAYDLTNSYNFAFIGMIGFTLLSILMSLSIAKPFKKEI